MTPPTDQKLVLAWDGSEAGARAVSFVADLARSLALPVEVLHVTSAESQQTSSELSSALQGSEGRDWPIRIESGDPAERILAAAADPAVVLVAMTTHGGHGAREGQPGIVAEQVLSRATGTLLVVRPEVTPKEGPIRHILVPLDAAAGTEQALRPMMKLAERLALSIDILHVARGGRFKSGATSSMRVPRYVDQPQYEWQSWDQEVAQRLAATSGIENPEALRTFLVQGRAEVEVGRFAQNQDCDAIALVRDSRLQPGRARVLRALLATAPCPLILCPPEVEPALPRQRKSTRAPAGDILE